MRIIKKKKADMTVPIMIAIAIGVIILILVTFMIFGKTKMLGQTTACEESLCKTSEESCDAGFTKSLTPCTKDGGKIKGRCCIEMDI